MPPVKFLCLERGCKAYFCFGRDILYRDGEGNFTCWIPDSEEKMSEFIYICAQNAVQLEGWHDPFLDQRIREYEHLQLLLSERKTNACHKWSVHKNVAKELYASLDGTRRFDISGQLQQSSQECLHRIHSTFQLPKTFEERIDQITLGLQDLSWIPQLHYSLFIWNEEL